MNKQVSVICTSLRLDPLGKVAGVPASHSRDWGVGGGAFADCHINGGEGVVLLGRAPDWNTGVVRGNAGAGAGVSIGSGVGAGCLVGDGV